MSTEKILPHLFRTEFSKITAVLCRLFGLPNIELAEDIVSDTFLLATETWGLKGLPENPTAWLYTVAKNKTKDYLKRHTLFTDKITSELLRNDEYSYESELDLSPKSISDSQLQMLFAICHPTLARESQIALALRILCGFGIDEIADAFLTNKQTVNKRLFRAKEKLRDERISIEYPPEHEVKNRLDSVLLTLYLLFNEGYYSASTNNNLRRDFCVEAMRLTYMLTNNSGTNNPKTKALLSLMCFHSSRFDARLDQKGEFVLYGEQDTSLWDVQLIEQGEFFLNEGARGNEYSKYHLEAAIAYWHTRKIESAEKWENILRLYNHLLQIEYSPIIALNRTYALSMANGKEEAIREAEKINMTGNHLYYSLLGNLYTNLDDIS